MRKVVDKYGNELQCGDFVCFTVSNGNWRQTPELIRVKVAAFVSNRLGDFVVLEKPDGIKVISSKVVKCY
jgi:hypothetical protein